jgi:hypothetical protein
MRDKQLEGLAYAMTGAASNLSASRANLVDKMLRIYWVREYIERGVLFSGRAPRALASWLRQRRKSRL